MKEIIRIIGIIIKSFLENCKDFFVYVGKMISNFLSTNIGQVFLVLTVLVTLIVVSIILYREIEKIHAKINIIGHFPDNDYDEDDLEFIETGDSDEREAEDVTVESEQENLKKEGLRKETAEDELMLEASEKEAAEQIPEKIEKEIEQPVLAIFEEVQKTKAELPVKGEGPAYMQAQIQGRLAILEEKVSLMEGTLCPECLKEEESYERQKEIERLKKKIVTLKSLITYYEELE